MSKTAFHRRCLSLTALMLTGLLLFGASLTTQAAGVASSIPGLNTDKQQNESKPVDYQALANLLADPKARKALIEQLHKLAEESGQAQGKSAGHESPSGQESISEQLAGVTASFFNDVRHSFNGVVKTLRRAVAQGDERVDWTSLSDATLRLAALLLATYVLLWVVDISFRRALFRLEGWARKGSMRQHLIRSIGSLTFAGLIGVAVIVGVYLLGNGLALWLGKSDLHVVNNLALFMNAFLVIELSRLAVRLVLVPHHSGLRLFPLSQRMAQYWGGWAIVLLWTVGYTSLFLVPLVRHAIDADTARALRWAVSAFALAYTIYKILRKRRDMATAMRKHASHIKSGMAAWLLQLLSRSWHVWAIAYFTMVFVVSVTRPGDAFPFVARATGLSVVTIGIGLLASAMLGQLAGNRIRLPDHHRRRVPLLERRLNTYLPLFLRLIRMVFGILVVVGILSIWHVVDAFAWLATDTGQRFLGVTLDIVLILILAVTAWLVIASLIEAKLNAEQDRLPSARVQTLLALFRNAVAIALVAMTVMIILSELGVNIGPLLAGAGVLGLAVGFGAQKLVQDVITGIFIQLENAINTGDIIRVGGTTGTVERLSIRSVGIRDLEGTFHIVPFSSVDVVSNYMRDYAYHKGEYGIAYRENIDDAIEQLKAAFDELVADEAWKAKILEPVLIPGVTALADSSVNIRVMIKTTPGDQWAVGRAYNRLVKMYFDAAGIEIPFPHTTLYFGEDKDGSAPPANLRLMRGGAKHKKTKPADDSQAEDISVPDPSNRPEEKVPTESDIEGDAGH